MFMCFFSSDGSMPRLIVEFDWGSKSTKRVFLFFLAKAAAKLTAVVVFPLPPFLKLIAIFQAIIKTRYRILKNFKNR